MKVKLKQAVGPNAVGLYAQIDEQVEDKTRIGRAAAYAAGYLEQLSGQSAVEQEESVDRLTLKKLHMADIDTDVGLALAMLCVSILEATRAGARATATEKVTWALEDLSTRYQADW